MLIDSGVMWKQGEKKAKMVQWRTGRAGSLSCLGWLAGPGLHKNQDGLPSSYWVCVKVYRGSLAGVVGLILIISSGRRWWVTPPSLRKLEYPQWSYFNLYKTSDSEVLLCHFNLYGVIKSREGRWMGKGKGRGAGIQNPKQTWSFIKLRVHF